MKKFDIGITTFSLRYNLVEKLVIKIRELGITNNIFLCVNGEKDEIFDESYRKKILNLCLSYDNIYPIFFYSLRGLSKMWNTLIIHSNQDNMLVLNDDIDLETDNIFKVVEEHINTPEYFGLSIINNTFSFYVVNKNFIDELGYFDERLLGFGEEDGDIIYRVSKKLNKSILRINCGGLTNLISDIRHKNIKQGVGKYSLYNREFIFKKKYKCDGDIYYFPEGIKCEELLPNLNQYPYEKFYNDNKSLL